MEHSKNITILFSPEQHRQLVRLADQSKTSIGELVRSACKKQYGLVSSDERIFAVKELSALHLPVRNVKKMKQESNPGLNRIEP